MSDMARELDRTCRRYSRLPSEVVGISDQSAAFDFDMAMAIIHAREQDSRLEALTETNALARVFLAMR